MPLKYSPSSLFLLLLFLIFWIFLIISMWKIFKKAGQPGWVVFIPIYNTYVLLKIAGRPGWWLILYFIPIVNLIVQLVVAASVGKMFGRSTLFGVMMLGFFSFIGYPILGFGKSQYAAVNSSASQSPSQPVQNEIPTPQPNPLPQPVTQQTLNEKPPIQQNLTPQQPVSEIPSSENKV